MITIVLSGGSGSRLWPVSREAYPKQFCEFFDKSFLRETIERVRSFGEVQIVTLESMGTLTMGAIQPMGLKSDQIILEPLAKNTAPAIALAALRALREGKGDEVLGVFPADHLITQTERFRQAVSLAESEAKKNHVVTIGIQPRFASTGYGYLELADYVESPSGALSSFAVQRFYEKPTVEKAEAYLRSGRYFWNAGIFFFKVNIIVELFKKHMPTLWKSIETLKPDFSNLKYVYANLVSQSIDYGIMEKLAGEIRCIPGDYGWSDVGSWDELARLGEESLEIDSKAQVFNVDAEENFVYANHNKVVGLCGVSRLMVVDTPDALLVAKRGDSQKVKQLVENMREAKLSQVYEHNFEVRPWGRFEVLSDNPDHKVKRIIVAPGGQLSYQEHEKRDEHWIVVQGVAEITLDGVVQNFNPGQQVYVRRGQKHRVKNSGSTPLVFIEVQTGQYFGEDDIRRFADDYNRA